VDVVLAPVLVLWLTLPAAVVLVPPVVALWYRRLTRTWPLLYVSALGLLASYGAASLADMDRADRTGDDGSIFAGGWWLVAAVAAATAACWLVVRSRRPQPATS
jgi:hypothetical protein